MSSGRTPANDQPETSTGLRLVNDVTCLACGCLCDDISVTFGGGKIVATGPSCSLGREWFAAENARSPVCLSAVEGRPVDADEALSRAAELIASARSPAIWGLSRTVTETVRTALALADFLRARVVLERAEADLGRVAAFQDQGRVSATLGEVKNRSDVVVFWGADPVRTHPRHWERYSVEPKGRFVPDGREGRFVVVVDRERTESAARADLFIPLPEGADAESLSALRRLVRQGAKATGKAGDRYGGFRRLAGVMTQARYGSLFFRPTSRSGWESSMGWAAATRLVRDLNEVTRFILLGMGEAGNLAGAEAAMTWQGGYLQGVDYRPGFPTPLDELVTFDDMLSRREVDLIVAVSGSFPDALSDAARAHFESVPRVLIGPGATSAAGLAPTVAFETSAPGYDAGGSVVRADGVVLPVRTVDDRQLPSDRGLLAKLLEMIRDGSMVHS